MPIDTEVVQRNRSFIRALGKRPVKDWEACIIRTLNYLELRSVAQCPNADEEISDLSEIAATLHASRLYRKYRSQLSH